MEIKSKKVVIIGVYAPIDNASDQEKTTFYNQLTTLLDEIGNRKELFIIGDLNGRTGRATGSEIVGRFGETVTNDNGERLIETCAEYNLKIWNGFFKHKDIHKYTWTQPTRKLKSIIDYVIGRTRTRIKVEDTRVFRGAECGSDHHLLKAKIYFPYYRVSATENTPENQNIQYKPPKYKLHLLEDPSVTFLYRLRLSQKLSQIDDTTPKTLYEHILQAIHQAANESLGEIEKCNNSKSIYWWNNSIAQLVERKKRAYNTWFTTKDPLDRQNYTRINHEVKKEAIKTENQYWDNKCEEVSNYLGSTRSKESWRLLKNLRTNERSKTTIEPISLENWKTYYEELMKEDRTEFQSKDTDIFIHRRDNRVNDITSDEVEKALKTFKNGRSPGPGEVNVELLKNAPTRLFDLLAQLFNKYLNGEQLPEDFRRGYVTNIFKKGDRRTCSNYRGITVLSSIGRLYGKILKARIES